MAAVQEDIDIDELKAQNILLKRRINTMVSEIEELLQTKTVLEVTDYSFKAIVQRMPVNMYQKDLDGRYIFIHDGYDPRNRILQESHVGKTDFELVPEELARKYDRDDQYVLSTGDSLEVVENYLRADGSVGYLHIVKSPLHDENGTLLGTQGIFRDITQQHLLEKELTQQRDYYSSIVEVHCDIHYADDYVFKQDEFMLQYFAHLGRWTGLNTPEEIAKAGGWEKLVHPDDVAILVERHRSLDNNEHVLTMFSLRSQAGTYITMRDTARRIRKMGGGFTVLGGVQNLDREDLVFLHRKQPG